MVKYLAIACAVLLLVAGGLGYLLKDSWEANGSLKQSVDTLTRANQEKSDATKSRATIEKHVRSLAPADKLDKLR